MWGWWSVAEGKAFVGNTVPYRKSVVKGVFLARRGTLHSRTIFCLYSGGRVSQRATAMGDDPGHPPVFGFGLGWAGGRFGKGEVKRSVQHGLRIDTWAFKMCLLFEI